MNEEVKFDVSKGNLLTSNSQTRFKELITVFY
jgi:hypothetical protein